MLRGRYSNSHVRVKYKSQHMNVTCRTLQVAARRTVVNARRYVYLNYYQVLIASDAIKNK
jgi:hypothetical protein